MSTTKPVRNMIGSWRVRARDSATTTLATDDLHVPSLRKIINENWRRRETDSGPVRALALLTQWPRLDTPALQVESGSQDSLDQPRGVESEVEAQNWVVLRRKGKKHSLSRPQT